uniref:Uncharacterized protein n=1 Tax=Triticum urartu TaxID=4572 RepID=A0A8R7QW56_TRIUA
MTSCLRPAYAVIYLKFLFSNKQSHLQLLQMVHNLLLTYIELIAGTPCGIQYFGELEDHYYRGNEVKLYEHQVDALFAMVWHKEPDIKYYMCTINKTFA